MAESNQYIRIRIRNTSFLIPAEASLGIESRDSLEVNSVGEGKAVAWKIVGTNKWPAFALDEEMNITRGNAWEQVVYVQGDHSAVGLAAENIQMVARSDIQVQPFTPVGPIPASGKHIFTAVWIEGNTPVLMFEPKALAFYLAVVGGGK